MTTAPTRPHLAPRTPSATSEPERSDTSEPSSRSSSVRPSPWRTYVALNGGHPRSSDPHSSSGSSSFTRPTCWPPPTCGAEGSVAERLSLGLVGALLLLLVGGLAINTFLPLLGVARPLDTIPVLILVDVIDVGLWLVRRKRPAHLVVRFAPGLRGAAGDPGDVTGWRCACCSWCSGPTG